MYKIGIVGFGKMGMLHGALLNGTKKAEVVAICDKSWVMRFGLKRVYPKVKAFSDIDKMLNSVDLDAVIIATPTFNHVESAIKCMKKGCHLFIEKPLASNYGKAKSLLKASKKYDVRIQVGFCNRFAPSIAKGKELLDSGIIGKVKSANAYMYIADVFEQHSGWRYSKETSGGGVLMDFGIHMLDQICWFFGKVQDVTATSKQLYSKEVEDELTAEINFKNGISVNYNTSWSKEEYRKSYARLEIIGEEGKMIVTDQTLEVIDAEGGQVSNWAYPELYDGAFMDVGGLLYSKQIEQFMDLLESKDVKSNLEESVYVQHVIEKIYESAEKKQKVLLGKTSVQER